jgi:uncharacterized BrkB/YihY/UPF0761 family membrane protein
VIALALFASTFIAVFALGFQSQNVNQGHYLAAALTSLAISTGHIALYRFMPEADPLQLAAYYAGGALGIVASMWVHRRTLGRKRVK